MKKAIAILSMLIFTGCGDGAIDEPEKLIDEEQMVDIIYDLTILEAQNSRTPSHGVNANAYILKKYKIDSLQFAQNNRYYASDIAKYQQLYQQVEQRINNEKKAADSLVIKSGSTAAPIVPPASDSAQVR